MSLTEIADTYAKQMPTDEPVDVPIEKETALLPIEKEAEQERSRRRRAAELSKDTVPYDRKFKRFDMSCLGLRRWDKTLKMQVPQLAVYNVASSDPFSVVEEGDFEIGDRSIKSRRVTRLPSMENVDNSLAWHYRGLFKQPRLRHDVYQGIKAGVIAAVSSFGIVVVIALIMSFFTAVDRQAIVVFFGVCAALSTIIGFGVWANSSGFDRLTHTLRTAFSGVIPDEVKKLIVENLGAYRHTHNPGKFQHILLVAEATAWSKTSEIKPRAADPLVVGHTVINDEHFYWLITQFDPTPVEEWAAREFAVKKN